MRRRPRLRGPISALLIVAAGTLVGCVAEDRPESCGADAATIRLTVTATSMEPSTAAACRGQDVTVVIDSEVDGVFHIHGLDDIVPATTISAGEETELEFAADRTGQFPVELHPADDARGVDIGLLTLHER
jgi:hypothetical protein